MPGLFTRSRDEALPPGPDALGMTLHVTQTETRGEHRSFRLTRGSAQHSEVRDDVVVAAERARALLAVAAQRDVSAGGVFSPGPAGVQVWSGPWTSPTGGPGTAEHLGSVDWSWDSPATGYVSVYRVMLTAAGAKRGLTTDALLSTVLALAGVDAPARSVTTAALPLPRDPFRSETWATPALTQQAQASGPAAAG